LRITRETKAISTILLIILFLCAIIGGAMMSYLWVMGNYYVESNAPQLAITAAEFSPDHADYFSVTVLNPSHSPSAANVTQISFTVEGDNTTHSVTNVSPGGYPVTLERGTQKTILCMEKWGAYAGKTITVYASGENTSGAARPFTTPYVSLTVQSYFNATESIKYFNVSVTNVLASATNLTLTNIYFNNNTVTNMTAQLPKIVHNGETLDLQCFTDWQDQSSQDVMVETAEGYTAETKKEVPSSVSLLTNFKFSETNTSEANMTVLNQAESATLVDITDIELEFDNGTGYNITQNIVNPALPYRLNISDTVTFMFNWSWANYRGRNFMVTAYTKQGFTSPTATVTTPKPFIFNIANTDFDLTATGFFLLDITNSPISESSLNISGVKLNSIDAGVSPSNQIVPPNATAQLSCTFDWTNLRGTSANVTVIAQDGLSVSVTLTLPSINLTMLDVAVFDNLEKFPYVNITISNAAFSSQNATITRITFTLGNATDPINVTRPPLVPSGYVLTVGTTVTITCQWDWTTHRGLPVIVTVQTQEGASASQTFNIPIL
jgi:hypothetical protein